GGALQPLAAPLCKGWIGAAFPCWLKASLTLRNAPLTARTLQSSITYCPSLYEPPLAAPVGTTLVTVTGIHQLGGAHHHSFHPSRSAPTTQTGLGNIRGCYRVAGIRYEPAKTLRGFPRMHTPER